MLTDSLVNKYLPAATFDFLSSTGGGVAVELATEFRSA
jgi:hypothetical protein